jgi:fimbrial isopeptide formation D2 family protein/LPXTG-motif cell wall-anchored protein
MKQIRKVLALVLAAIMISAMALTALAAVNISITRDSSYNGNTSGTGAGNTYTYYKMFEAVFSSGTTATNASGHTSGTPNTMSGTTTGVSYKTTTAVKEAIEEAMGSGTNPQYFVFTAIAGDSAHWNVAWNTKIAQNSENIIAAAAVLKTAAETENLGSETLTQSGTTWSAEVDPGYYVIEGATGNNLIAATTDIEIAEKNTYPSIDKTQNDAEDGTSGTYIDDPVKVAVGDIINYHVEVTVPTTAKVGDTILVWDKNTVGLSFNNDVESDYDHNPAVAIENDDTVAGAAWAKKVTIKDVSVQGQVITFSFSMTVNDSALVDTGKKNESAIKYGNSGTYNYETLPDEVLYKTFFGGIHKYDGETREDLEGVKFTLKESGTVLLVAKSGSYYYPVSSGTTGSGTVVTDRNGQIIIRGLDDDKTYTLTEIETLAGYNMLTEDVVLTLTEDDASGTGILTDRTSSGTWSQVPNLKGTLLPSTGGIGTTIFYVVGTLLVLGAGLLLVTRRRMHA